MQGLNFLCVGMVIYLNTWSWTAGKAPAERQKETQMNWTWKSYEIIKFPFQVPWISSLNLWRVLFFVGSDIGKHLKWVTFSKQIVAGMT